MDLLEIEESLPDELLDMDRERCLRAMMMVDKIQNENQTRLCDTQSFIWTC